MSRQDLISTLEKTASQDLQGHKAIQETVAFYEILHSKLLPDQLNDNPSNKPYSYCEGVYQRSKIVKCKMESQFFFGLKQLLPVFWENQINRATLAAALKLEKGVY